MAPAGLEVARSPARAQRAEPPAVEVHDVSVRLEGATIVEGIDFEVKRGEVFMIMGPSGCGKTTLLRALARLLTPSAGEVVVLGRRLRGISAADLRALRREVAMVFQGGALLSSLPLDENVALPMRANLDLEDHVIDEAVRMKLSQVGLLDAVHKLPAELSGGMRKRASIARGLALDPNLLLLDEPTSGLDPVTARELDQLILELREGLGVTIVAVTHDLDSARRAADRILVLSPNGRPLELGTWAQVRASEHEDVREFMDRGGPGGAAADPTTSRVAAQTERRQP